MLMVQVGRSGATAFPITAKLKASEAVAFGCLALPVQDAVRSGFKQSTSLAVAFDLAPIATVNHPYGLA